MHVQYLGLAWAYYLSFKIFEYGSDDLVTSPGPRDVGCTPIVWAKAPLMIPFKQAKYYWFVCFLTWNFTLHILLFIFFFFFFCLFCPILAILCFNILSSCILHSPFVLKSQWVCFHITFHFNEISLSV